MSDVDKLEKEKAQTIAATYREIGKIVKLLGHAGKLANDVVGGHIKQLLHDELKTQHKYLSLITNGGERLED